MLFQKFPTTLFDISRTEQVVIQDFIRAVKIDPQLKENSLFFDYYEAKDNEMPEIISHKFYKSTQYHWVIMLINEKFDPYNDFPKSDDILIKYAKDKFGNINAIHHYEDSRGNIVDQFATDKTPITNIDYIRNENEKKRIVKILKRSMLDSFVDEYQTLVAV